jgi:hypothetical protein
MPALNQFEPVTPPLQVGDGTQEAEERLFTLPRSGWLRWGRNVAIVFERKAYGFGAVLERPGAPA